MDDDLRRASGGAATASKPQIRAAIRCGAGAERDAIEALDGLDEDLEPLVREHALAIISALLHAGGRAERAGGGHVTLEASVDERELRVELGDECLDLRPATLARRPEGLPAPVVALVERLADSWRISYDGRLRLWFAIAR